MYLGQFLLCYECWLCIAPLEGCYKHTPRSQRRLGTSLRWLHSRDSEPKMGRCVCAASGVAVGISASSCYILRVDGAFAC